MVDNYMNDNKEQLRKEHTKWTIKYMESFKREEQLLSSISAPPLIEKFIAISSRLEQAKKDMDIAWAKMLEIQRRFSG